MKLILAHGVRLARGTYFSKAVFLMPLKKSSFVLTLNATLSVHEVPTQGAFCSQPVCLVGITMALDCVLDGL